MTFNKDKMGNVRNRPFHWTPERAGVQIDENPDDKEAFIHHELCPKVGDGLIRRLV